MVRGSRPDADQRNDARESGQKPARICLAAASGALLFALLSACERTESPQAAPDSTPDRIDPVVVLTTNYPLAWMTARIGGPEVDVRFPAPAGVDPAHWQPDAETVLEYQDADLVVLNGAGYANWVQFASLAPSRLVDTTRGLAERFVDAGESTHSHGPGGEHDHGNVASHTWLDPTLAAAQAVRIHAALARATPTATDELDSRLQALQADLVRLDDRLRAALDRLRERGVLYSHPVYQYLDARYELAGRALTWEPDADPGEEAWRALSRTIGEKPARLMLWEAPPLTATAARLRAMNIEPVVFATGAATPSDGDYLDLMHANIARLDSMATMAVPRE